MTEYDPATEKVHLSQLMDKILANKPENDKITLRDMIDVLGVRAYGSLLLLFAIPNAVPSIPGLMAVLGAPLVILAIQMMLGMTPWLPDILARQGVTRTKVEKLRNKVKPTLSRLDRVVHARWLWVTSPTMERVLGFFIFVLSLSVFLPIPFTNMLPAWAICLMAVGFLERDGMWVLIGVIVGVIAALVVGAILGAVVTGVVSAFV